MRAFGLGEKKFDGRLYDVREIETIKDIVSYTTEKHGKYTAYMFKEKHGEPFVEYSYKQFKHDMDALGTQLIGMGLKGAKIAVTGDNSHRWVLTYLTTVCGVGCIVPIDKNLEQEEICNLLTRADVRYIFTAEKQFPKIEPLLAKVPTLEGIALLNSAKADVVTGGIASVEADAASKGIAPTDPDAAAAGAPQCETAAAEAGAPQRETAAAAGAPERETVAAAAGAPQRETAAVDDTQHEIDAAETGAPQRETVAAAADAQQCEATAADDTQCDEGELQQDDVLNIERITTIEALIAAGALRLEIGDESYVTAEVEPEDLSTILFTSGTTGLAKGVMLSHRNLAKNVQHMSEYFHAPKRARALSVLPMHHAYEMTCTVLTAFYQAATVVICEGLRHMQPNFLEAECSIMLGVPLVFENIHKKIFRQAEKSGEAEQLQKGLEFSKRWGIGDSKFLSGKVFKSVRSIFGDELYCLIAGGAGIDPVVIEDFRAMGMPIIQGYGMTESAPLITVNPDRFCKAESVGLPLPGTKIELADVDENGIGEIIVRGPSVMKGYYKDEEATKEAIVDGWLHSGDYGYIDSDGFVYITGRKKNVIVTKGGKNIFPEEVEFYLLQNEEIADVIVYGKENILKDDLVCTAIVQPNNKLLKAAGINEPEAVYRKLREIVEVVNDKVPAYKRIKRLEIRENDFIKTTTMKIKRFEKENYEYKYDDKSFDEGRRF